MPDVLVDETSPSHWTINRIASALPYYRLQFRSSLAELRTPLNEEPWPGGGMGFALGLYPSG